jgi:thiamine-monophosphate kinase
MVVTTDFSLEGRHFRRDWHSAESAGHRCLARGLSDLAAMGAKPVAAFLSLALPKNYEMAWVDGFLDGLLALAERAEIRLAGGDTSEAPEDKVLADIVCVGAVRRGKALLRSKARAGDGLYCTGSLGGSAVELARRAAGFREERGPQTFPEPRLAVGQALLRRGIAASCMDVSDGLATDLRHVCVASGVDAEIDSAKLPLGVGAAVAQALTGGEDYELLFTARAAARVPKSIAGVKVTRIGTMVALRGAVAEVRADGETLGVSGWEHLS